MPRYFELLGISFSVYWTVFCLGILCMVVMNLFRGKKYGISIPKSMLITLLVVIISFLGAKLLFYIENPSKLINNGLEMGGVSFFGSMFLAPVGMYIYCKISKNSFDEIMDFISPSLMLMLAVLRIGCFLSECCGGVTLQFEDGSTAVFPVQIVECVFDIFIMIGLIFYEKVLKCKGRLYYFIMVYYGVLRFVLEFLRETPKDWLGMAHGQWFAIISIAIGGYMLHRLGVRDKKANKVIKNKKAKKR